MVIKINAIEVASEIAHRELLHEYGGTSYLNEEEIFVEDENGDSRYTEKAQDVFNDLYDFWLSFILKYETGEEANLI